MKVHVDLFPARVRVVPNTTPVDVTTATVTTRYESSRLVTATRIVIIDDVIVIAADSSEGPTLIFRERIEPTSLKADRTGRSVSTLVTVTGKHVIFDKDNNCGCGSRLRAWNPYRMMDSNRDPSE